MADTKIDLKSTLVVQDQLVARPMRQAKIQIIDAKAPTAPGKRPMGTVTVFFAKKGSRALTEVKNAVSKGGDDALNLLNKLLEQAKSSKKMTFDAAMKRVAKAPVFGEVRYAGQTLYQGAIIPDKSDLGVMVFPYNGGKLAADGLVFVEHYLETADYQLEALAVRMMPDLTAAELAAIKAQPAGQAALNIATAGCGDSWTAAAVVVAALVLAFVTGAAIGCSLRVDHIPKEIIDRIGPAATARQLVQMRRDLLRKNWKAQF